MSEPILQGLLADCDAEAVLRNAWCEFGGSNMDAEFWQVFSEAVNFTLKMAAACIGEAPAQTILRLTRERDEAREALRWYVDHDDTVDDMPGNEFWIEGRDRARALLGYPPAATDRKVIAALVARTRHE